MKHHHVGSTKCNLSVNKVERIECNLKYARAHLSHAREETVSISHPATRRRQISFNVRISNSKSVFSSHKHINITTSYWYLPNIHLKVKMTISINWTRRVCWTNEKEYVLTILETEVFETSSRNNSIAAKQIVGLYHILLFCFFYTGNVTVTFEHKVSSDSTHNVELYSK